jgi:cell division protein FtsW
MGEPCALFLIILALLAVGVLMVYSASRTVHQADGYYFTRHLTFVPVAMVAFVVGVVFPYRWLRRWWVALPLLAASVGLLVLVLFIGAARGGAKRWLMLPLGLNFQPSELAKFVLVIFLAWYFSRGTEGGTSRWEWVNRLGRFARPDARSFIWGFGLPMAVTAVVCVPILKEDLGTGALVGAVAVLMCMLAGWRLWWPLLLAAPGVAGFFIFVYPVEYRMDRIRVWLDPWAYYDGPGWHVCQSLMALGRGGWWGVGLGAGIQKLYIPENTTDFVFAVLCEEMGLAGALLVIGLFAVFIWRGGRVVRQAPDHFAMLLAAGILLVIGLQAILNIGVVSSALPAKGISLPFISYGGSGLVMMCFAAGLLASVARAQKGAADGPRPLVSHRAGA